MKVLVLGASGVMGRRAAAELARAAEVTSLVLSARDARAEQLAEILGGIKENISHLQLDVTDRPALQAAMRNVDVVVSCAGPFYLHEVDCVRAAIDTATHYVSLCDDHVVIDRVVAQDAAARDAGITVVSGCGVSPGITNFLVAQAAQELDAVDEIELALAGSSADRSGPATVLHFIVQMSADATFISDYSNDRVPGATAPKLVYFPEPVGWVETFRCGHPEMTTLPLVHGDLRTLRYRAGLTERAAMDVLRASLATGLLSTEQNRRLWLKLSNPVRPLLESMPPRGAAWTGLRVDVHGQTNGRPRTVSFGVVDRLANLATIPLALAAVDVTKERGRGVRSPEQVFDPKRYLKSLIARGIRIARLEAQQI
ncbi:MAG: saccharopine dehydrogenase NADP-binding domain-containing protein [Actinomycetota bacterium]|nr:saccharopine dehydrogenase NADP-binding domain-containing protein [Actinomycetota bacterium]